MVSYWPVSWGSTSSLHMHAPLSVFLFLRNKPPMWRLCLLLKWKRKSLKSRQICVIYIIYIICHFIIINSCIISNTMCNFIIMDSCMYQILVQLVFLKKRNSCPVYEPGLHRFHLFKVLVASSLLNIGKVFFFVNPPHPPKKKTTHTHTSQLVSCFLLL